MKSVLGLVVVVLVGGCAVEAGDPVGSAGDYARGTFCGGFAGFPCPEGYTCVDNPRDGCDPEAGGADCGGICRRTRREPCEHGRGIDYISNSPEECAAILFLCAAPAVPFFNDCGCGCRDTTECDDPNRSYVSRDPAECAVIRFTCASGAGFSDACGCGCLIDGGGTACGPSTCAAGQVCCNASCGICTEPDGFCTQQACEPVPEG